LIIRVSHHQQSTINQEADMSLAPEQEQRYSRNVLIEQIGEEGQERLLASKVLIVGAGGLGSASALYLAAAGVGTLGLLDGDAVDVSNLQRQVLHTTADVGKRKVVSAKETIEALNPDVTVETHDTWAKADNLAAIVRRYQFVIDATDNFPAKFLINDACYFERVPFSHAGILELEGQTMTVLPGRTACYRCIFGGPPKAGKPLGVLGAVPAVIGSLQATEAIKYLLGIGTLLTDCLLTYSSATMKFRKIPLARNPNCPLCGHAPRITELKDEPVGA
jgi:molybdopterin/thiamine biosynthesis adenylyltransferase